MNVGEELFSIPDPEIERTFRRTRRNNIHQRNRAERMNPYARRDNATNAQPPPIAVNQIPLADDRNRGIRDYADLQYIDLCGTIVRPG